jgi:hypothetical protein
MNVGMAGGLNLTRLQGCVKTTINGEAGIFLPYKQAKLVKNNNGVFLNIYIFPFRDGHGNDYMCVRSKTKEELNSKQRTEVLGNIKNIHMDLPDFVMGSQRMAVYEMTPEEDIDPFEENGDPYDQIDNDDFF